MPLSRPCFKPVRPPTTFEETVERLGTAIRLGLLPAGSKLPPERKLATELRISRSTLREALTTLTQSGHLIAQRGRGGGTFVVKAPPLAEREPEPLGQEAWSVSSTAWRSRPGRRSSPVSAPSRRPSTASTSWSRRWPSPGTSPDYRRADIRFHIGVAEAARSPRLVIEMTEVQGAMSDLIALIAHPEQVLTHSNAQHAALVKLLRRRDATRAVGLMREHIEGTEHILAGLLPALRLTYARIRSPFGSNSGSAATSPSIQRPKISIATGIPGSARSGGTYAYAIDRPTVYP